jgi:hypothetical protein
MIGSSGGQWPYRQATRKVHGLSTKCVRLLLGSARRRSKRQLDRSFVRQKLIFPGGKAGVWIFANHFCSSWANNNRATLVNIYARLIDI